MYMNAHVGPHLKRSHPQPQPPTHAGVHAAAAGVVPAELLLGRRGEPPVQGRLVRTHARTCMSSARAEATLIPSIALYPPSPPSQPITQTTGSSSFSLSSTNSSPTSGRGAWARSVIRTPLTHFSRKRPTPFGCGPRAGATCRCDEIDNEDGSSDWVVCFALSSPRLI